MQSRHGPRFGSVDTRPGDAFHDPLHIGEPSRRDAARAPLAHRGGTDAQLLGDRLGGATGGKQNALDVHAETLGGLTGLRKSNLTATGRVRFGSHPGTNRVENMAKNRPLTARENVIMDRLERILAERGLSWSHLARVAGKTTSSASQWSGRRSFPRESVLHKFAQELGVGMGWLLSGDEPAEIRAAQTENELKALEIIRGMSLAEQAAALAALAGIRGSLTKK